jgi:D-alanyl-D-alanine carboxypeptidase/D-alanyl-D-alanine-endopeptidase (penicillin-binding protein 4)
MALTGRGRAAASIAGLAMVLGGGGLARAQVEREEPGAASAASRAVTTPLLSARRTPGVLVQAVAGRRLEEALTDTVAGTAACVAVEHDGVVVAAIDADRDLTPASTLKLLTAVAVLARRGADARFTTALNAAAPPEADGTVRGDVVLVGGGDPTLSTPRYDEYVRASDRFRDDPLTPLQSLVDALRDAGVRRIDGAVVGDGTRYGGPAYLDTWKPNYRTEGQVGPIGALTVNHGFADFPPPVPVDDPALYAAEQLTVLLERSGIDVASDARAGTVDGASHPLGAIRSPRLADIVAGMLTSSDNTTAEMLLRELAVADGAGNDTIAGVTAMRAAIDELGIGLDGATLLDGSGLSPGNAVDCNALLSVLTLDQHTVERGLADAGESGTLATRFVGHPLAGRLHAKTGQLQGVAGLAGFVDGGGTGAVRFAFLANGGFDTSGGQQLQQRVAEAVATYPDAPGGDDLVPDP